MIGLNVANDLAGGSESSPRVLEEEIQGLVVLLRGKTDDVADDVALRSWDKKKREPDAAAPNPHQNEYDVTTDHMHSTI